MTCDCDSPLCPCKQTAETTFHFFFECNLYLDSRNKLYLSFAQLPFNIISGSSAISRCIMSTLFRISNTHFIRVTRSSRVPF